MRPRKPLDWESVWPGRRARADCPSEERLLAFASGSLSEADGETIRDHLAGCAACVEAARDARAFLDAMASSRGERPASRTARPLLIAASLVLAAAGGLLLLSLQRPGRRTSGVADRGAALPSAVPESNPWRDLRIPAAVYAPTVPSGDDLVFRSDDDHVANPSDAFRAAMKPYAAGDFGRAEKALATFLAQRPGDARASFYRGIALIQLGRHGDASAALDAALAHGNPQIRQETLWYRALLKLKEGHFVEALSDLDSVAGFAARRQEEAERLRSQVRAHVTR